VVREGHQVLGGEVPAGRQCLVLDHTGRKGFWAPLVSDLTRWVHTI
jgi:hypothetical protein